MSLNQLESAQHPRRYSLRNELGQRQTPPSGGQYFQVLGQGRQVLVIGLGPEPKIASALVQEYNQKRQAPFTTIHWVDSPDFRHGLAPETGTAPPAGWLEWSKTEAEQAFAAPEEWTFVLYLPGLRLFPSWYGPLFGAAWAAAKGHRPGKMPSADKDIRRVTLAGSERNLLHRELRLALESLGLEVLLWDNEAQSQTPRSTDSLPVPPEDKLGDLLLSVNFRGLDAFGAVYQYLRARGSRVAVWCVDNPWHLLTSLRSPYWMELPLFVTDDSFLPGLTAHGAKNVHHLPLAACPELMRPELTDKNSGITKNLAPLVFVGRTAFPDRDKFFAAQRLAPDSTEQALHALGKGQRPDFLYWTNQLGLTKLWPGQEVRKAGLAAETLSKEWRRLCVSAGLKPGGPGVTIFGDAAWGEELADERLAGQPPDLRAPLDYYDQLPSVYAAAQVILNATGLLLPAGLNQRHFDVWMAGGALLSDDSPGLKIFPRDLTRPMVYTRPDEIPLRAAELLEDGPRLAQLKKDWRCLLSAEHTYKQRMQTLLEAVQK